MGELSARNFGLLIAYVLPGFVTVWALSQDVPAVDLWLAGAASEGPSLAGIPYILLACIGAGMVASGVRWALLDTLHHRTGIPKPDWNDAQLIDRLPVYQLFIEIHYRYYQFYANSLVSGSFAYVVWRRHAPFAWTGLCLDAALLALFCVFYAGSRDTLRKYYGRTATLLGLIERKALHDQRRPSLSAQDSGHSKAQINASEPQESRGGEAASTCEDGDQNDLITDWEGL